MGWVYISAWFSLVLYATLFSLGLGGVLDVHCLLLSVGHIVLFRCCLYYSLPTWWGESLVLGFGGLFVIHFVGICYGLFIFH